MFFYLGLISVAAGVYLLLKNLNIIQKKNEDENVGPKEAKQIDNLLIRLASIGLCAIGIYLMWPEQSSKKTNLPAIPQVSNIQSQVNHAQVWNDELKEMLIKQCLENGKRTAEDYPELVNDYCKCATERISQALTPEQYAQWMEKPKEEQVQFFRPIVETCAAIMNKLIELTKENIPQKGKLQK